MKSNAFTTTNNDGRQIIVLDMASQVLTKEAKGKMTMPHLLTLLEISHTKNEHSAAMADPTALVVTSQELDCDEIVMILSASRTGPICIAAGTDVQELEKMVGSNLRLSGAYELGKATVRAGVTRRMQCLPFLSDQPAKQKI